MRPPHVSWHDVSCMDACCASHLAYCDTQAEVPLAHACYCSHTFTDSREVASECAHLHTLLNADHMTHIQSEYESVSMYVCLLSHIHQSIDTSIIRDRLHPSGHVLVQSVVRTKLCNHTQCCKVSPTQQAGIQSSHHGGRATNRRAKVTAASVHDQCLLLSCHPHVPQLFVALGKVACCS